MMTTLPPTLPFPGQMSIFDSLTDDGWNSSRDDIGGPTRSKRVSTCEIWRGCGKAEAQDRSITPNHTVGGEIYRIAGPKVEPHVDHQLEDGEHFVWGRLRLHNGSTNSLTAHAHAYSSQTGTVQFHRCNCRESMLPVLISIHVGRHRGSLTPSGSVG
ncbi:hypothetical protein K432DRAFT_144342 [Lepidopterella palustris CBS 459.81]|uniref:Uncharacterized protein n=1 Tax=Lepidopterella palustris CBS 459.81 TaxID=1314670 RepID=A0A8E2ELJ2_9PEZI|nr:hypothetical protein K432DRAFT_144342 [Lepidopterella palustris CBS 459.81]